MNGEATPTEEAVTKTRKDRIEFLAALLIGIAAVFTAYATFQGAEIDGKVAEQQTEALANILLANDAYNDANAQQAIERDWFFSWITEAQNETPASLFLEEAMPEYVRALAEEWLNAPDDIADPFSPEAADSYDTYFGLPSVELTFQGNLFDIDADCAVFRAEVASVQSENYGLSTVFFAISLVTAGIAALLRSRAAQYMVLTTATVSLVLGLGILWLGGDETEARTDVAPGFYLSEPFVDSETGEELTDPATGEIIRTTFIDPETYDEVTNETPAEAIAFANRACPPA